MTFAATDEFHQSFFPSRTATAHDVMIDIIGAIVGLLICWMFVRRHDEPVAARSDLVGLTGLEPVTLRLSSACSNQLSYRPANFCELMM